MNVAKQKREIGIELFGVALDYVCEDCEGTGEDGPNDSCATCGGAGYELTEAGKALCAFMERHVDPSPDY